MDRKIFILIGLVLFINLVSASFSIDLKPSYYLDGKAVVVYGNEPFYDGVAFEVIGKNLNRENRIINLTVVKASHDLISYFPESHAFLISGQETVLWKSDAIPVDVFDSEKVLVKVGVEGINEVTFQKFYSEGQYILDLSNIKSDSSSNSEVSKDGVLERIYDFLYPQDREIGTILFYFLIVLILYVMGRQGLFEKIKK